MIVVLQSPVRSPSHKRAKSVVELERERAARAKAEARVLELEETIEMRENDEDAPRAVRFEDGGRPAPRGKSRQLSETLVPAVLLVAAENHVRGLQAKLEAHYDEVGALECKLEVEVALRLRAERELEAEIAKRRQAERAVARLSAQKETSKDCPVCYASDVSLRRLACCDAIACIDCLREMFDDKELTCSDCLVATPVPAFDIFVDNLPSAGRPLLDAETRLQKTPTSLLSYFAPGMSYALITVAFGLAASAVAGLLSHARNVLPS